MTVVPASYKNKAEQLNFITVNGGEGGVNKGGGLNWGGHNGA